MVTITHPITFEVLQYRVNGQQCTKTRFLAELRSKLQTLKRADNYKTVTSITKAGNIKESIHVN